MLKSRICLFLRHLLIHLLPRRFPSFASSIFIFFHSSSFSCSFCSSCCLSLVSALPFVLLSFLSLACLSICCCWFSYLCPLFSLLLLFRLLLLTDCWSVFPFFCSFIIFFITSLQIQVLFSFIIIRSKSKALLNIPTASATPVCKNCPLC